MNRKQTEIFLAYLARAFKIDVNGCFEVLKPIYSGSLNFEKKRFFDEFSFVMERDGSIRPAIRVLNLLFPENIRGNLKDFKANRLKNIICAFYFADNLVRRAYSDNVDKIRQVADFVNKNGDWLLQFGFELEKGNNLRTKVYFGNANRKTADPFFAVKILEKISETFGITHNKLVNSIIFSNKIDAIAVDLIKGGIGLKIYDYAHFPDKKQMNYLLAKYETFNCLEKDRVYDNFKMIVRRNRLYGKKNFDTMFTYRFGPNSMGLESVKINVHVDPLADASRFFSPIGITKKNKSLFDFMKKNKIKLSFLGHESGKIFFYVR